MKPDASNSPWTPSHPGWVEKLAIWFVVLISLAGASTPWLDQILDRLDTRLPASVWLLLALGLVGSCAWALGYVARRRPTPPAAPARPETHSTDA